MLRGLGTLPALPGIDVTWVKPGCGFYHLPHSEAGSVAQLLRQRSGGSRSGGLKRTRSSGAALLPGLGEEEEAGAAGEEGQQDGEEGEGGAKLAAAAQAKRQRRSGGGGGGEEQQLQGAFGGGAGTTAAAGANGAGSQERAGSAAQAEAAVEDPAQEAWVQCVLCSKWRCLPLGCQVGVVGPTARTHSRSHCQGHCRNVHCSALLCGAFLVLIPAAGSDRARPMNLQSLSQ